MNDYTKCICSVCDTELPVTVQEWRAMTPAGRVLVKCQTCWNEEIKQQKEWDRLQKIENEAEEKERARIAEENKKYREEKELIRLANLTPVKRLADKYLKQFECKKTGTGKQFLCIKDNAPDKEILSDMLRECHGDKLPDDYVYEYFVEALEAFGEYDDPQDYANEIEADVYTSDLLDWMQSHPDRLYASNEAINSLGATTIDQACSYAQCEEKQNIFYQVSNMIEEQLQG